MLNQSFITEDTMSSIIETFPALVYQKNKEMRYVALSESMREFSHYPSKDMFIGHKDHDLSWHDFADRYCAIDHYVMQGNTFISLEKGNIYTGEIKTVLTQKIPVIDLCHKITGVACFSIPIPTESVFSFTQDLFNTPSVIKSSLRKEKKKTFHYKDLKFTRRQAQCLSMMLRGATIDEIANQICRSPRTVQKYYEGLREKLGSTKHSIVFQKAIEYGFIDLMFTQIE